jgi:SAM-dependent methyltransferase
MAYAFRLAFGRAAFTMSDTPLPDRGAHGYEVYARGMEASAPDKAKLLPWVRPGTIADLGCGTGTVLELLARAYPQSRLVAVDMSAEMLGRCRARLGDPSLQLHFQHRAGATPQLTVISGDISERQLEPESVDTIVLCSIMHEVFSYKGYDYEPVRATLVQAQRALKPGGRVIVRDGVKPRQQDAVYLTFLRDGIRAKFERFAREFGSGEITWRPDGERVRVARRDAFEFLSKYIYDTNWAHEVREHFGVFTLDGWSSELELAGFHVVHRESYLLDYLRTAHYERDVRLEVKLDGSYVAGEYPHSTMLIVGEKQGLRSLG